MTSSPKFPECPYATSRGRCYHKHREKRNSKVKGVCGYKNPNNCGLYCEWLEIRNITELNKKSISTHSKPLKPTPQQEAKKNSN